MLNNKLYMEDLFLIIADKKFVYFKIKRCQFNKVYCVKNMKFKKCKYNLLKKFFF